MAPKGCVGGIRHHKDACGGKDGNRLINRINHGLPQFQISAVATGLRHFGGNILERQGKRTIRVGSANDAVGRGIA